MDKTLDNFFIEYQWPHYDCSDFHSSFERTHWLHISPHCHYTLNLEKRIKITFFQAETKMGCSRVLPSKVCCCSLDLGLQVIVFLCQKVGIGKNLTDQKTKSINKTVMLPSHSVLLMPSLSSSFTGASWLPVFPSTCWDYLQWILWLTSFWYLPLLIFHGCPLFDSLYC